MAESKPNAAATGPHRPTAAIHRPTSTTAHSRRLTGPSDAALHQRTNEAATYEYDGKGRRMQKVVSNSGDFDGTMVYLYDGWKIVETRDGSNNVQQQFIHGTQYIDELVMVRAKDNGDLYVHQDANWNVIGLTDLGGSVVERYVYTPYGELTVQQDTDYGDRDGDGVVDATDKL